MIISNTIDKYNINYFHKCEPVKNSIIPNSKFYRLIYSSKYCTINTVYFILNYSKIICEKMDNKYKYKYKIKFSNETINHVKELEEQLLSKINNHKRQSMNISEHLFNEYVKIINNPLNENCDLMFLLKISGIWENDTHKGLTFKVLIINK